MASAFSDPSLLTRLSTICSLGPEDILNEILQDKSEKQNYCRNCDEVARATSRCKDCDEMLCENCVMAHLRVKVTKDHCIIPLENIHVSPSSSSSYSSASNVTSGNSPNLLYNTNSINCELHLTEPMRMYCDNCSVIFCQECTSIEHRGHNYVFMQDALECARNSSLKLITEAKVSAQAAKDCLEMSQRMQESINSRSHIIVREIKNMIRRFHTALEERENELLIKLERIRSIKHKSIQSQIDNLKTLFSCFLQSTKTIIETLEYGSPTDLMQIKEHMASELNKLKSIRNSMSFVDDNIQLVRPDYSVLLTISCMGDIIGGNQFQRMEQSPSIGQEILRNVGARPPPALIQPIQPRNYLENFSTIAESFPIFQPNNGEKLQFERSKLAIWSFGFRGKEFPINNFKNPRLRSSALMHERDYREAGNPFLIIGGEGEEDGKLCRPWGVCCSSEGNIIVADRSNNRIQIFKPDGTFFHKFGTHGSDPGCFDRPAGIATDPRGRIVVADKDNHRIQVFSKEGIFLFLFGEKGSKFGQFNYPWDVAVDVNGRIVVSDTRNHRVQLFNNEGVFLAVYGFDGTPNMVKHFDSPRGVSFGVRGCVIVSDFNNHRLVVIDSNFRHARFLGCEGCGEKQFLRPQGIVVDPYGNILVADSRNNRIQVFENNGSYLCEFGSAGREPGQLDRPSGISLTPTGKIVVVDFGNNRIQVF